jgi:hypothetical protein
MNRDDIKLVGEFAIALLVLCALAALLAAPLFGLDYASCRSQATRMGMAQTWGPLQGCMVEYTPGKWIAIERFRAVDAEVRR